MSPGSGIVVFVLLFLCSLPVNSTQTGLFALLGSMDVVGKLEASSGLLFLVVIVIVHCSIFLHLALLRFAVALGL